jgi:hypothetical protein
VLLAQYFTTLARLACLPQAWAGSSLHPASAGLQQGCKQDGLYEDSALQRGFL